MREALCRVGREGFYEYLLDGWRDLLGGKIHTRKIFLGVVVRSPLPRFAVENQLAAGWRHDGP